MTKLGSDKNAYYYKINKHMELTMHTFVQKKNSHKQTLLQG